MKFFLESAIISEIETAHQDYHIDGLLVSFGADAENSPSIDRLKQIATWAAASFPAGDYFDFPVSVALEQSLNTVEDIVETARRLRQLSPFIITRLPCTLQGVQATHQLVKESIPIHMAAIFNPVQAIVAAKAGAAFVSPVSGWQDCCGGTEQGFLREVSEIYHNYSFSTEILVAGLQSPHEVRNVALVGAEIVAGSLALYQEILKNPLA